ncbi:MULTISPECIES: hypothetical protein [unclassified Nonomuraea]|uniref:hypothetical protein n=1 Tax=unclassified Nonomuraea TaxID=2593643 RepID=UPI0033CB2F4C
MSADQSLICPSCQGVVVAAQSAAYTPARGRLIVTNGYCRGDCSDVKQTPERDEPVQATAGSHRSTPAETVSAPR